METSTPVGLPTRSARHTPHTHTPHTRTARPGLHPRTARPATPRPRSPLAGLGVVTRLVLGRNWVRLQLWFLFVVGMLAYVARYYTQTFTTQQSLDDFAQLASSPGMLAISGVPSAPATLGGAVWSKIWMTLALGLALGLVFLVTRNTRAEEELGRAELLRSRVLGIHAQSVATWATVALLCVGSGIGAALVAIASGLDPEGAGHSGSWLFGLSVGGVGLVGLGVAALASQLTVTSRGANALASAVIGVFFLARMAGDLGDGTLTWASPIGWGQEVRPWGGQRWWPLLLQLGLALVLLVVAALLEEHRDHGAGLLPERTGRADAPRRWTSPLGLSLHLERGSILAWTVTLVLGAAMFGSVTRSMQDLLRDASPEISARLGVSGMDSLVAVLVRILALLVLAFAVQTTLPLRADEASGLLEVQLSRGLSRTRWALGRLMVPVLGSLLLLALSGLVLGATLAAVTQDSSAIRSTLGATLVYWPAVLVVVAVSVLVLGWVPRATTPVTWVLLVAAWTVEMVGDTTDLPKAFLDATPFHATPSLPAEDMDWTPLLVMVLVALVCTAGGLWRLHTRDIVVG